MLALKGINKIYKSGRKSIHALKDLSLEVETGEILGVLGRPGSGKSSLIRCINLLERPNAGTVTLDNYPLSLLSSKALRIARRSIGMVTKQPALLSSRSVYDNLALPLEFSGTPKETIESILNPLLNIIGLVDKTNLLPIQLSSQLQQRLCIARALVHQPKLLLCDEITSLYDAKVSLSIMQLLREIHEHYQPTMIITTSDVEIVKTFCHRVVVLHQGTILENSSVVDLFTHPKADISKEFVKSATRLELPMALRRRLRAQPGEKTNPVVRLSFLGPSAKEPLIAELIQQFGLTLNIMQAHLETIADKAVGIMIIEMIGQQEYIQRAIDYSIEKGLNVEVLGYVPRSTS